ncbi:peptide/nickel transport system substrate-binding protein [Tistlia consotensis]|uniref:Peptide/nickel transport system substrate-binding protein n=1 Tax=Tistlia consotensis USBA 355 TaxID=560819 RepID=A0A1Y6CM48_9PROT|nr:ABC transporter substrate-binding protein [Tistlia consotensis]SMF77017.1 peptide/nickel transport system substrate-binding protein [Tistlia consotensis USBA 355]SNS13831.1 peptide/nickel transport system substrate-binding protein [Tistlia consotensis]
MDKISRLTDLAESGLVDRRGFMTGALALGLTVGAASSLWSNTARAAAKKGGHLRLALGSGSTTDSLDPATLDSTFNQILGYGTLRNCLTEVKADSSVGPELAESWEAQPDASTWVFTLRKGVTFHSGKTVTTDDVIASMEHHRAKDSTSAAKPLVQSIESMKADGPDKIVFKLTSGNADFPYYMADYHLCILPSKDGKVDATSGDGTGGFILENFEPGVRATAKRNPNYFKSDRAWFDSVELLSITDPAARTNAITTGEVDVMERVDLKTVNLLKRRSGINVIETVGLQHYTMPMITTQEPFNDNDVRLALKYAVKREELLEKVLRGYGRVGNDQPLAPANRFYATDIEQRTYDPDKAKFHLKKAGRENLKVKLSAADAAFAGAVEAAVLYQASARAAGIEIEVVREPNDGYWSNVWLKKPFCMCYWGGRPTADQMFTTVYSAGAPWNDAYWTNDKFNKLLVEARATLDQEKRAQMYREMQLIVRDEGGTIIPLFASYVDAATDKIGHGDIAGNYALDGLKLTERWWFA